MGSLENPNTRLLIAAKNGDLSGVGEALSDGAIIDYAIGKGWTAAMWAARRHHVEVFAYLAEQGADLSIRDGLNHDAWDISALNYLEDYSRSHEIQQMFRQNARYGLGVAKMKAESQAFAKILRKKFGGRTKSGDEVSVTYQNMQCKFMVFAGGFDLWINNFHVEDMHISLNIEGIDNKLHPEEMHGKLAVAGFFSEGFPLYYFPSTHSIAGTNKFLAVVENVEDLGRLKVNRYEWLVIVPGQLRLRNQSTDMNVIESRLNSLANIFSRCHKPTPPPLLPQRYAVKYSRSKVSYPVHRLGGASARAIKCPQCGEDFCQLASFDSGDVRFADLAWKRKTIVAALCPVCSLFEVSSTTCVSYAKRHPVVMQQIGHFRSGEPGDIPERTIELAEIGPRKLSEKSRIGGSPEWIQGDETPDCPSCNEAMRFFAQFASDEKITIGADMGAAYVFLCQPCVVIGVAIQSW